MEWVEDSTIKEPLNTNKLKIEHLKHKLWTIKDSSEDRPDLDKTTNNSPRFFPQFWAQNKSLI